MQSTSKVCITCKVLKTDDNFYRQSKGQYLSSYCKPCANAKGKAWAKANPEMNAARSNAQYHKNPARHAAYAKTSAGKYGDYKSDSSRRHGNGIKFSLTKDEFMLFWQKPCHYCNDQIETVGLDRVDNAQGYFLGNVVSCCTICNLAKRSLGRDEFIFHCRKIVANADRRSWILPADVLR